MQHGTKNPNDAMPTEEQINNARAEFIHQQTISFKNYSTPVITMSHPKHGDVKINADDKQAESHWIGHGYERGKGK